MLSAIIIILTFSSTHSTQYTLSQLNTHEFTDGDVNTWTIAGNNIPTHHRFYDCNGVRLMGGYDIFTGDPTNPVSISKTWNNLPPHYQITLSILIYKIDSWNQQSLFIMVDGLTTGFYTWNSSTGTSDICGQPSPTLNTYNSQYNEMITNFTTTLNHTASTITVSIVSSLNSWIGAWGIRNVKMVLERCESSCSSCQDSISCLSCDTGLTLVGLYCECPLGQRRVTDGRCWSSVCSSCVSVSCPSGYYIYNASVCAQCNTACSVCTGPANSVPDCSTCATGFFMSTSNVCDTCYSGCSDCFGFAYNECNACEPSYFLSNNECLTVCPSGHYSVEYLSICQACVTPCMSCDGSTSSHCLSCIAGMYLYGSDCYSSCPYSLYGYDGECVYECPLTTFPDNSSICYACPSLCQTCPSNSTCNSCENSYYYSPFDSLCYSSCPFGYYNDEDDKICLNCDPSCLTCSGPSYSQCLSCYPLHFMVYSVCYLTCPSRTYGTTCQLCDASCYNCSGPSPSECTSCQYPLLLHLNQTKCMQQCYEGDVPDNELYTCMTCPLGKVGVFWQCQLCSQTCQSCFGISYLECKSCVSQFVLSNHTCLLNDSSPIIAMPGLQSSPSTLKQVLSYFIIINICLTLILQCLFKYKTNLLPTIQIAQTLSFLYYFSIPLSQSSQSILISLFNFHPSLIFTAQGYFSFFPSFKYSHPQSSIFSKILLTQKTCAFLIDSLYLHLIFIICLLVLGIFKLVKGYIYHKLYPYLITYAYRLLFMEHVFTIVIFLSYIDFGQPLLIGSFVLLLVDILLIVISFGWKIRTDTQIQTYHFALFYFNEMGKPTDENSQNKESIIPSLVYYIGKIPIIIIIIAFEAQPFAQTVSFLVYVIILTVVNFILPYRRRFYAFTIHFLNITLVFISIILLLLSLSVKAQLFLDYMIIFTFCSLLLFTIMQIMSNYRFLKSLPKFCLFKLQNLKEQS